MRRAVLAALALAAGAACGRGAPPPRTHAVEIRNFAYVPAEVAATPGDTIVWTNRDAVPHTATAGSRAWDTGNIAAGESGRVVVPEGAEGEYVCAYHPNMRARLTDR
ncbi:MAG TPA: hypothetical protein VFQ45_04605 [Longimicrobium sp.]|nr:hypothetical protein [Longimicrobium sp.]